MSAPLAPRPKDHYELTRPFTGNAPEPILYVSLKPCPLKLTKLFGTSELLGIERVILVEKEIAGAAFLPFCEFRQKS